MLPIKLQLYNFMSYGENVEPLDFQGINLACLAGNNGVGKSSLLEAVTWALWGKSRAKSDDDLMRLGEEEMWVDFEFEVEGVQYRILRKRSRREKKNGKFATSGSFDFMTASDADRSLDPNLINWQSLSESTKAETQQKVIDVLKMDYDTFVNSAFLRQGHADEFTVKKPQERKKILADILGLSYYDQLQEKAKELKRSREVEKESSEQLIFSLEDGLKDKETFQKEEIKIAKILKEAEKELNQKEESVQKLTIEKNNLEIKKSKTKELSLKIEELEREIRDLKKEFEERNKNFQKILEIVSQKKEIEDNFSKLEKFKEENSKLTKIRLEQFSLTSKRAELQNEIAGHKKKIEIKQANIIARIKEYEKEILDRGQIENSLEKIKRKISLLKEKEEEKEKNILRIQKGREKKAELKTKLSQIETLGKEIKERMEIISEAKASCPLCSQTLTDEHKKKVKSDLLDQRNGKAAEYKKIKETIILIDKKIVEIEENINDLDKELLSQKEEEKKLYSFEKSLEEIKRKEKELADLKNENKSLVLEMEKGSFDPEDLRKLREVEERLEKMIYSEKQHKKIEEQINQLSKYESLHHRLTYAQDQEQEEKETLERNKVLREKKEKLLEESIAERDKIILEVRKIDQVMSSLIEENRELQDLKIKISDIQSEYGAIKERIQRIKSQEMELKEKKKKLKNAGLESSLYDELARAFSKTGIQAMIIEGAIPEIEDEANHLLSKMTDGKLEVKFLTQKEKKTDAELQETLDIKIIDEVGTRDYEMFSGGEAFRINFAIRIALSKLLAKRSGAKLQLLVIDEGFGTQDNIGQEYIIDAINSIKNDFKKILIITHIQSLKDVFQTRIEVNKGEDGSKFEVMS